MVDTHLVEVEDIQLGKTPLSFFLFLTNHFAVVTRQPIPPSLEARVMQEPLVMVLGHLRRLDMGQLLQVHLLWQVLGHPPVVPMELIEVLLTHTQAVEAIPQVMAQTLQRCLQ